MRARKRLATVLCLIVAAHLGATLLYVARPVPLPSSLRSALTGYMEPVFKQTWSVFAPDPVSLNTRLQVRARTNTGQTTPWFDVSTCDVDSAIKHHPVPNRRYLTTFQLVKHYRGAYAGLPDSAQSVARADAQQRSWPTTLPAQLVRAGAGDTAVQRYLKNDRAMTAFSSLVAHARWGNAVAVQVQVVDEHTVPFAQRDNDKAKPRVEAVRAGWRPTDVVGDEPQAVIDGLYAPTAGCAS